MPSHKSPGTLLIIAASVFVAGYAVNAFGTPTFGLWIGKTPFLVAIFFWQAAIPCIAAALMWRAASLKASPLRWACVALGGIVFVSELLLSLTLALPENPFTVLLNVMPFFQFALRPWAFLVLLAAIAAEPHTTMRLPVRLAWMAHGVAAGAVLIVALSPGADQVPAALRFIPMVSWAVHLMASWVYFGSALGFASLGVTNWLALALIDLSFVYFTYWLVARVVIAWRMASRVAPVTSEPSPAGPPNKGIEQSATR